MADSCVCTSGPTKECAWYAYDAKVANAGYCYVNNQYMMAVSAEPTTYIAKVGAVTGRLRRQSNWPRHRTLVHLHPAAIQRPVGVLPQGPPVPHVAQALTRVFGRENACTGITDARACSKNAAAACTWSGPLDASQPDINCHSLEYTTWRWFTTHT